MRVLKAVVIVMAVLIFVGLGVLVWGLFNLSTKDKPASAIAPAVVEPPLNLSLGLADGCEIDNIASVGDRLIVLDSCGLIRIVDLGSGRLIGTVTR